MMTSLTDRPLKNNSPPVDRARRKGALLTITAVGLAVALVGLGAWVAYDMTRTSETAVTGEIGQVIDDYHAAYNNYDGEAFLELVTDGYVLERTGVSYVQAGATESTTAAEMIEEIKLLEEYDWRVATVGEPLMMGDGPWFVSVASHFESPPYGPEGADGISTFTIVDEGGTLKVARHSYVGNN